MMFKNISYLRREHVKNISWPRVNKDFLDMMKKATVHQKKKLINLNLSKLKLLLWESFYDEDKNARHRLVENIYLQISHLSYP